MRRRWARDAWARWSGRRRRGRSRRTQREVIRDVMLLAKECGAWLTLREIAALTRYGEASISAQLRHLRKPPCGGYAVVKQRRGDPGDGVWEYQLQRPAA